MSNRQCCVPGCLNSLDTNANLHKFPNPDKDKELFNKWVYSVGGDILQLGNEHIFKYRRVCQVHFEQKYCCWNNRLSKDAVWTRNMPDPITSHRCATVSRDNVPMHATVAAEDVQINQNLEHHKKQQRTVATRRRVKRVALTQSEHALYKKLMLVGVKLSIFKLNYKQNMV